MDRSVEKLLLAAQDTGIANAARAWQLKNDSAAGTAEELNARMAVSYTHLTLPTKRIV